MKKAIIVIFFAVLGFASASHAQAIVVRPPVAVMVRPVRPAPGYVWYGPRRYWNRRMNAYVWANGYWGRPRGWHARWKYRF